MTCANTTVSVEVVNNTTTIEIIIIIITNDKDIKLYPLTSFMLL